MSTRLRPTVALLGTVLAAVLLAGCNVAPDGAGALPSDSASPGGTMPPSDPSPPSPSPSGPVLPPNPSSKPPPAGGQTTLTGMVEMSEVEGGCKVLRVGTTTYELMGGDEQVLSPGNRVVVEGKVNPNVATICQVGPVFEVTSARRA